MKERYLTFPDIMCPIYTDPMRKPLILISAHIRGAIHWAKEIKSNGYSRGTDYLLDQDINAVFYSIRTLEALNMVEEGTSSRIASITRKVCSKLMR